MRNNSARQHVSIIEVKIRRDFKKLSMVMLRYLKIVQIKSIASVYTILSVYWPGFPGNLPCLFFTLRINIFVEFGFPDLDNAT